MDRCCSSGSEAIESSRMTGDIPVLVMHGDDDQIVPIVAAGLLSAKILKNATLEVYPG
jgi:predicted esterase